LNATAQTPPPLYADPLAPNLQTDPRRPPVFQKFTQPGLVQLGAPANFSPPASGAGSTGFDSTNFRKKTKPKGRASAGNPRVPASDANAASPNANVAPADANISAANARAIAPGVALPLTMSPYQSPATTGSFAQAPGAPPVELGPIRKLPPKRKAHTEPDDPYAPLGVHVGAFTLFPAIEFIGGYDTNPARTAGGTGASLYSIAPELLVQSNWSRHELKAELRGSYTGYSPDETPTLSRPNFNGKIDGRIDVTRDTRVDLETRLLVSTDNPGSPNLQAGLAKLPIFTTIGASAGLGQTFSRFDLAAKGDFDRTIYQNSTLTDGSIDSNDDRNYNQYGGTLRGSYELSPGVKPYVEVGADTRVHDLNADFFDYQRDSKGLTGLAGSTFRLANVLTGDVGIGYGTRSYEDPRLERINGVLGNASLIWTANALTTVKFTAASTVGESTVPGVSGQLSRDVGLQVDHSLRRWLIATIKLGFGVDDYVGMDREDRRLSAGAGLTYKINRSVQIKGEFQQNWLHSNVAGTDYTSSVFLLGIRFQR
jgi:hypothetical protein